MGEENLNIKAREALRHIRNWLMRYGKFPSVRDLMTLMNYKSPRSTMLLLQDLEENGFLERKEDGGFKLIKDLEIGIIARTVSIPLVGSVPCGGPLIADENIEAMIQVSVSLAKPGSKYFLLRAMGDSMDKAGINNGDLVLIKQQSVAENGQKIVALIDDAVTVKEYQRNGDLVTLMPRSNNPAHKPIILTHDFQIQGIVINTIPINHL
jgi:repressor LexA